MGDSALFPRRHCVTGESYLLTLAWNVVSGRRET
jgi:hypothetical protein